MYFNFTALMFFLLYNEGKLENESILSKAPLLL